MQTSLTTLIVFQTSHNSQLTTHNSQLTTIRFISENTLQFFWPDLHPPPFQDHQN